MTPTAHPDDPKRDRREALRPFKSRLKIKTPRPQPLPPQTGKTKPVSSESLKAWPRIVAAPYALPLGAYSVDLDISTWQVAQMRRIVRHFKAAGVEPSGDWRTDKHFTAPPATPLGTPPNRPPALDLDAVADGSGDPVLADLLDAARTLAADAKATREQAETLNSRAACARRLVIDYATLHSIDLTVPPAV